MKFSGHSDAPQPATPVHLARSDPCIAFANAVAGAEYDRLSPAAVSAAKKSLLDTLGVIAAASALEPNVSPIISHLREAGGRAESSVIGFGGKLPAAAAAFANGAMAHCLDFDDRTSWGGHCGSSLIPTTLALAEKMGGVSGKTLIAAIAARQDMFVRLRCCLESDQHWNVSTVLGLFAATAGASRILGLDKRQTANALAIASMQASGTMQVVYGGSTLRGIYAGFTAQAAVTAGLLAQKGLGGVDGVFDGKAGVLSTFFSGRYSTGKLLEGLGQDHRGAQMVYKPWPVVGLAHTYIHATLKLMERHRIEPGDVEAVRVFVSQRQLEMCLPLDDRRAPRTAVAAKFSLPYCVAAAAVRGAINLSDFSAGALADQAVLDMAHRVVPVLQQSEALQSMSAIGRVEMSTRDGRIFEESGNDVPGSLDAPLDWEALSHKFVDCVSVSNMDRAAESAHQIVAGLVRLEDLDDAVSALEKLSCQGEAPRGIEAD